MTHTSRFDPTVYDPDDAQTLDQFASLVSNRHRRRCIRFLGQALGAGRMDIPVEEVAEAMMTGNGEEPPVDPDRAAGALTAVSHVHLPKLRDAGLITVEAGMVTPQPGLRVVNTGLSGAKSGMDAMAAHARGDYDGADADTPEVRTR